MLAAKYFTGCMVAVSLLLSCSKNNSYDVKGDPEVKFYTNNTSSGNTPGNSINYGFVNVPDVAGSGLINLSTTIPAAIKFPVLATKPVSSDVTIGAELDNSLIAAYNASHNTNYVAFPAGILNTAGLAAHIMKNATSSADSITINTDLATLNTLTEKAYMAPIKLTTVSSEGVGQITSSSESKVTYIVANMEYRRIKFNAVAADAQGALINPRTSWTVAFSPTPTAVGTGSILDGLTTTYSRWGTSPGQVDVDMQATTNVTGIRLYTSNNGTHIPTQVQVYLSNNGINYDLIGSPLRANLTYASSYNYILFYKAIAARYVRLRLLYTTSTNSQNTRITEFDVYAN